MEKIINKTRKNISFSKYINLKINNVLNVLSLLYFKKQEHIILSDGNLKPTKIEIAMHAYADT
jgi:hypothetical protein